MMQKELNKKRGERLRRCIEEKNVTQKSLAADANFTEQHISKLVKGKSNLTTDTARTLSRILGVRMEYLLYEDDFKTEIEKISSQLKSLSDISQNICNVLSSKGYRLVYDEYINSCETFKIVSISYPYEIEGKTAQEIKDNIIDKLQSTNEQNMIALKHPDGRIIRITSSLFNKIVSDIENYIDYQMHMIFSKPENYLYISDMEVTDK